MHQHDLAFTTPADVPGWQRWLVFSPLARIALFVVLFIGCGFGLAALVGLLGWNAQGA